MGINLKSGTHRLLGGTNQDTPTRKAKESPADTVKSKKSKVDTVALKGRMSDTYERSTRLIPQAAEEQMKGKYPKPITEALTKSLKKERAQSDTLEAARKGKISAK